MEFRISGLAGMPRTAWDISANLRPPKKPADVKHKQPSLVMGWITMGKKRQDDSGLNFHSTPKRRRSVQSLRRGDKTYADERAASPFWRAMHRWLCPARQSLWTPVQLQPAGACEIRRIPVNCRPCAFYHARNGAGTVPVASMQAIECPSHRNITEADGSICSSQQLYCWAVVFALLRETGVKVHH